MSDYMLHGVLNMPLPDDPKEIDLVTWVQFRDRAREAAYRIRELEAERDRLREYAFEVTKALTGLTSAAKERAALQTDTDTRDGRCAWCGGKDLHPETAIGRPICHECANTKTIEALIARQSTTRTREADHGSF